MVGAQLGQTLVAGPRDRWVWLSAAGSLAALGAVIQTPGVSGFFDCRPLGPMGWAQGLTAAAAATAGSLVAPRVTDMLFRAVGEERVAQWRESLVERWVTPRVAAA